MNLLAGRARTLSLHPFTATELGTQFNLDRAIRFGLLPTVVGEHALGDPWEYLRGYVGTYLREEVQQKALVRNLGAFHRFPEAAGFSQTSPLHVQAVASDCGIPRKTAENHFDLLEDLLLAVGLPVFRRRAAHKWVSHPKFFFFDAGVYRALRPRASRFREADLEGLQAFCADYPEARGHLLYGGTTAYRFGAIDVVPLSEGLFLLSSWLSGAGGA